MLKPRVNGCNIVGQQLPTLLDVTCRVRLHTLLHVVRCCCVLLRVVAQSLKPVKLFSQQLPTFLLFRDRRSVAQQCWIRLQSSSNIVGATHAQYTWITKTYGLCSSHDAPQVPNLLGVVASVCTPLSTSTQQLPTLLAQQCWELLRTFACSLTVKSLKQRKVFEKISMSESPFYKNWQLWRLSRRFQTLIWRPGETVQILESP